MILGVWRRGLEEECKVEREEAGGKMQGGADWEKWVEGGVEER